MTQLTTASTVDEKAVPTTDRCTAIIVSAKASTTGSPMTTHTADCADCDWRAAKVEARDWAEGSQRPIYHYKGPYPRQVREDRGVTWSADSLEPLPQRNEWAKGSVIVGYIPQVRHTYALIEGSYGIMNEHGLAMGESTCAAKFYASPVSDGGKALLDIGELSQIALERTKTAREAIKLMGSLAEEYGYYSAGAWEVPTMGTDYGMGEGGEALTVIDKNEAWVFHILADDTGSSAIWVAQRVPDGHVSVVANQFVIKEVDPNSPDFMYSSNLWSMAEKHGFWNHDQGLLHFTRTYAPIRLHPNYATRRMWRVLSKSAPTLNLPGDTNEWADDYPFSVPLTRPEGLFSPKDIMWLQRDHYEGTPYSTTEGLAAGPYGDPNRWDYGASGDMTLLEAKQGEFQRTISLFRTSYSFVATPRNGIDDVFQRLWLSHYAPDSSSYTPIYIAAKKLSPAWTHGTMHKYDSSVAWWNFAVCGNYAARFYSFAIDSIRSLQYRIEDELIPAVDALETSLTTSSEEGNTGKPAASHEEIVKKLTEFTVEKGDYISKQWKELFPVLLTTYRDGYVVSGLDQPTIQIKRIFYPRWWLQAVGFFDHPGNKAGILFAPNNGNNVINSSRGDVMSNLMTVMITGLIFFLLGFFYAKKNKKVSSSSSSSSFSTPSSLEMMMKSTTAGFSSSSPASSSYQYSSIPDHDGAAEDVERH